ncbi:ATP-binding protein [Neptunomonas antarctica]|uniref:ATP-binding protein n=1 Tax=Neptunomonas antarctica TaxID=619304 RepID=UPI00192E53BF|nr:ATP-binding protein [Neptunomonas antarctica]
MFLRIDTIEQAIRDLCDFKVEGEGYRLSYRIAADNLVLGNSVIADSCNPIELSRIEWNEVVVIACSEYVNIEVICYDVSEHRRRVETRAPEVPGLKSTSWKCVVDREYHPWRSDRIVVDTARSSIDDSIQSLFVALNERENI